MAVIPAALIRGHGDEDVAGMGDAAVGEEKCFMSVWVT